MQKLFIRDFRKTYPDYFDNELIKEDGDKAFKKILEKSIGSLHFFESIPMRLGAIINNNSECITLFRCAGFQIRIFE